MPLARRRMTGVEGECPVELGLGADPVPVEAELDEGQRRMRLGEPFVQLQRLQRGAARLLDQALPTMRAQADGDERAAIRQPRVRQRVLRIFRHGSFEERLRELQRVARPMFKKYRPRR